MSLPEVQLVLQEDQRREASRALVALQGEALAAFAVWDKRAGRQLESLGQDLQRQARNDQPAEPSPLQLSGVFSQWGVSVLDG